MPGPERRASSVTRNALSGGGRHVVSAVLALAVTPYALSVLGPDRFGAWVLAGTVLLTIRTFDLGLERALIRAVANADGVGRLSEARPVLVVGRRMLVGAAIVFAGAISMGRGPIIGWLLEIPEALRAEATYAVIGTAAVAVVEAWFRPFSAALDGVGRMDRSRSIDTFQRILSSLGVVIVLGLGYGLRGLVWKNAATALLAGALYVRAVRQSAPELAGHWAKGSASTGSPRSGVSVALGDAPGSAPLEFDRPGAAPLYIDGPGAAPRDINRPNSAPLDPADRGARAIARDLLAFGGHVQAVGISALAYDVWTKVILGRVGGLGGVAIYELGARVVTLLAGALQAAVEAIFPEASVRHSAADTGRSSAGSAESRRALAALHARAGRAVGWLALPAFGLLFVLAVPFASAWLGPEYAEVGDIIRILSTGWLVAILAGPAYLIAQAGGRAADGTAAAIVTAIVAMGLSSVLVGPFGAIGIATSVSVGLTIGSALMWWRFARGFGVGWGIARIVDPRALVATVVAMVVAWGTLSVLAGLGMIEGGGMGEPDGVAGFRAFLVGTATSLLGVIGAGIAGGATYPAAMVAMRAFGDQDRKIFRAALAGLVGRGRSSSES